jgi:hypothetical protein
LYKDLPDQKLNYIIGVDIGWVDADAIAVLAYSFGDQRVYLVEEHVKSKQTISELVSQIKFFQDKYSPVKMVMDAGALGKKIQEEILQRHQLVLHAAEKTRKLEFIELLNDDLRTGRFKARPGSRFEEDSYLVQWDRTNPEKPTVSDTYHSDVTDAVLYAWRECKHFIDNSRPVMPKKHTEEYMDMLEQRDADRLEAQKQAEEEEEQFAQMYEEILNSSMEDEDEWF